MKGIQFQDSIATGTSLLTFLAPKVCCWNGAIAAISSGSSYLAWVYPLRPYLFGLAFLSLAYGFYREYYQKNWIRPLVAVVPTKKIGSPSQS